MTANAGYHAYATGDVLTAAQVQYNLQNQTVMYFATTTARDAALTGAILVEGMVSYTPATGVMYYNGTAWTAVGSSSPLTTKGDLYTYSTTNARLPVGSNGQTLVANSGGTTGNAWQDPVQQNPVLNSAFQVWQRGTSVAVGTTTNAYTADRWNLQTGGNQACTVSRQATNDTTNLPSIQYCARVQRNSGQTGTGAQGFANSFESINSIPFAGKTVNVSFYARAGANYSPTSSILQVNLYYGTGTDQNINVAGYTGVAAVIQENKTLTTTWQRFTTTAQTVSTSATELALQFAFTPTGTAGTNDYFEITGVQLEVGSVATPFHTFSTTIQGELAACQRYYIRTLSNQLSANYGFGIGNTTTQAYIQVPIAEMRIAPTTVDYSTLEVSDGTSGAAVTSMTISAGNSTPRTAFLVPVTAGSVTALRPYLLRNNASTSGYLGLGAEL